MPWDKRENIQELMDDPARTDDELRAALKGLRALNTLGLSRRIIASHVRRGKILDVATGCADIPECLRRRGLATFAVGLDVNTRILRIARQVSPLVALVRADARHLPFKDKAFDSATCHLFFHHLDEATAARVLREMDRVARQIVVLDLLRRRRLYVWVKLLTFLSSSELVRFDGPVSVRRSYSKHEVESLVSASGVKAKVETHLFHRWCVTAREH